MDNILEEKLRTFSSLVMADAGKKGNEIAEAAEEEAERFLSAKEDKLLNEAYNVIQKNVSEYSKVDNERILKVEVEAKKQILLKREGIINEVFEAVNEKINSFIKSSEYEKWLVKITEKALSELNTGKKSVYLVSEDMKYADTVKALDSSIEVFEGASDLIGGVVVTSAEQRISVDYSLKSLIEAEKSEFLQNTGLSVE